MSRIFEYADNALRYGKILTNEEFETFDGYFIRIRVIDYNGQIYYHKLCDGELVSFISLTDETYE